MNFEQVAASLYVALSKWQVAAVFCGLMSICWLRFLVPFLSSTSPSASLLSLASHCDFLVLLGLETSFLVGCVLVANATLYVTVGLASFQEYSAVVRRLVTENSFLQVLIIALGQENINAVELIIWTCIFSLYTVLRGLFLFAESRYQSGRRQGLDSLLWTLLLFTAGFVWVASWCFWEAGLLQLLQMHYDGVQLVLQTVGLILMAKWNSVHSTSAEIRITALAHGVGFLQWAHFLLAYMKWLGFPIQFFLFYKLTKMIQMLQQDVLRYRGFHTSTGLFLQQCPPLPSSELASLGDERCCMCWEALRDSSCSRLPCGHIHHVDCIRRLMMSSMERKCPLCKQVFLLGAPQPQQQRGNQDLFRVLAQLANAPRGLDHAIAMVREVVPQASDEAIRRELELTRSVHQAIANLVDQ